MVHFKVPKMSQGHFLMCAPEKYPDNAENDQYGSFYNVFPVPVVLQY
jgi:hypothetical protein